MRMTQAEYLAYEARRGSAPSTQPPKSKVLEREIHEQIAEECRRRGWIFFHGSMAHKTHRTVGEPDFLVMANNGRFFAIEAKTSTGKLSPEQQSLRAWAEKLGHKVHLVRSLQDFIQSCS